MLCYHCLCVEIVHMQILKIPQTVALHKILQDGTLKDHSYENPTLEQTLGNEAAEAII